jgi:hypothetical protein
MGAIAEQTRRALAILGEEADTIQVNMGAEQEFFLIPEKDYTAMMFTKIRMAIASYNTSRISNVGLLTQEEINEIRKANVDYIDPVSGLSYNLREETNLPSEVLNGTLDIFLSYVPEDGNGSLYNNPYNNMGLSMFEILYREQALMPLKNYLNGFYSDVKSVIYTHSLKYVTRAEYKGTGATNYYGVPNNYVYGDYDYMIFNDNYVNPIISPNGNGVDKSDYIPVGSANTKRFNTLLSELKTAQANGDIPESVVITDANNKIIEFSSYEEYIEFTLAGGDFAVARVSGSMATGELFADKEKHSNLDVYIEGKNSVTNTDEFCDSMFCIGLNAMGADGTGERAQRSMDIIRLINTNKEFRNILQYGVEGTHYSQYTEDEDVNILSSARPESKYLNMNPKYLGNMFLLYSSASMTDAEKMMAANNWQMAKDQMIDLVPWITEDHEGE